MALIRCPECGKEISDSAQVCPNCGCKTELGNQNEIMKTSLLADIGFTVLGIICAIFAFVAYYTVSTDAFVVLIANYAQTECQFRYCGTAIPFLTVRSTAR